MSSIIGTVGGGLLGTYYGPKMLPNLDSSIAQFIGGVGGVAAGTIGEILVRDYISYIKNKGGDELEKRSALFTLGALALLLTLGGIGYDVSKQNENETKIKNLGNLSKQIDALALNQKKLSDRYNNLATPSLGPLQIGGTALGGYLGATYIPEKFTSISPLVGGVGGAVLGNIVGKNLDKRNLL